MNLLSALAASEGAAAWLDTGGSMLFYTKIAYICLQKVEISLVVLYNKSVRENE